MMIIPLEEAIYSIHILELCPPPPHVRDLNADCSSTTMRCDDL